MLIGFFRERPVLLAAPLIAATALLPWQESWLSALAAIIVLGVPHGALDGEIARTLWRDRLGSAWFLKFALPYLGISALVLAGWQLAPRSCLVLFLAASVWHFGSEDVPSGRPAEVLFRGGLPIALPLLVHPAATLLVFATIAQMQLGALDNWLWVAALCWLVLAVAWMIAAAVRNRWRMLVAPALLGCMFVLLPPLTAFAIYFVCVHAPAHVAALISNRQRAVRVRSVGGAWRLALPVTALTLVIGALLWPFYDGTPPVRLLCLTVQSLAALTLPHMLLDAWASHLERRTACRLLNYVGANALIASGKFETAASAAKPRAKAST